MPLVECGYGWSLLDVESMRGAGETTEVGPQRALNKSKFARSCSSSTSAKIVASFIPFSF